MMDPADERVICSKCGRKLKRDQMDGEKKGWGDRQWILADRYYEDGRLDTTTYSWSACPPTQPFTLMERTQPHEPKPYLQLYLEEGGD